MIETSSRICISPWCDDTERFINEGLFNQKCLHKHDDCYIIQISDIINASPHQLDLYGKSLKKLTDFTQLVLMAQSNLKNLQLYKNSKNELHYFLIAQCQRISNYYQRFDTYPIASQIKEYLFLFQNGKIKKREFIINLNKLISQDYIMETKVFKVVLDSFERCISTEELKQHMNTNESLQQYLFQKFSCIISMRFELIQNLISDVLPNNHDSYLDSLKYLSVVRRVYNYEYEQINEQRDGQQTFNDEIQLLNNLKTKLIESFLNLADYLSSQYDIQSTFTSFTEIYKIDIYNKRVLEQLLVTLKKFGYSLQTKIIYQLSLIIFPSDIEVLSDFLENLYPENVYKQQIISKINSLNPKSNSYIFYQTYDQIFSSFIVDLEFSSLFRVLPKEENIRASVERSILNAIGLLKNVYFIDGIPQNKLLDIEFNIKDAFSYTLQKQAERKEQNQQKEKEKKKPHIKFEHNQSSGENKRQRNSLEKKFENFKQQTKQRRSILSFVFNTEKEKLNRKNSDSSHSPEEPSLKAEQKDSYEEVTISLEANPQAESKQHYTLDTAIKLVNLDKLTEFQTKQVTEQKQSSEEKTQIEIEQAKNEQIEQPNPTQQKKRLKRKIELVNIQEDCITIVQGDSSKNTNIELLEENKQTSIPKAKNKKKKQKVILIDSQNNLEKPDHQNQQGKNKSSLNTQEDQPQRVNQNLNQANNEITIKDGDSDEVIIIETKENNLGSLCEYLCCNPFDQESFLQFFSKQQKNTELFEKYKEILSFPYSKNEMSSFLLNLFSAASYYYSNDQIHTKRFLCESSKYFFNNVQRINQIGFHQLSIKQSDAAIQNFETSIMTSNNQSQWFPHASLGYIYSFIYQNQQRAINHLQASLNLKEVETSFYIHFLLGQIYYFDLKQYHQAYQYYSQGFQLIFSLNQKDKINKSFFSEYILDYSLLNYRIGNYQSSKNSIDFFFTQNPNKNQELAYYLLALINLKQGDYQNSLNAIQIADLTNTLNSSLKIELLILKGFIAIKFQDDLKQSKELYKQAWALLDKQSEKFYQEKRIRVLKQLIFLHEGTSFYQASEMSFLNSLSKTDLISYLEFLFQYGVARYNIYTSEIIDKYNNQDSSALMKKQDEDVEEIADYSKLIKIFQDCIDNNHRKMESFYMMGKCYKDLIRDYEKSLAYFYIVLKMNPLHLKSLLFALEIQIFKKNYEEARILIKRLDEDSYDSPQKIYFEGKLYQEQENYQKSIELYLKLFNSQRYTIPLNIFKLIQQDFAYCSYKIQETTITQYIQ